MGTTIARHAFALRKNSNCCRVASRALVQCCTRRPEMIVGGRLPGTNSKVNGKTQPHDDQECKRSLGHLRLHSQPTNAQDAQYQMPQSRIALMSRTVPTASALTAPAV
jgi:hypothetical protein